MSDWREWLRRVFHLGPDFESIERASELADETLRNVEGLREDRAAFHRELAQERHRSDVARALLRARDITGGPAR